MADISKVSQQYVRVLKTANRVAKKHGEKIGELRDDVIQNINMIQVHAKKGKKPMAVDAKVLARFSVKAKTSQAKLKKILEAKVAVPPRTIKPVFVELTKQLDDFISVANINDLASNKLPKGQSKGGLPRVKVLKIESGGAANIFGGYRAITAIGVNNPGKGKPGVIGPGGGKPGRKT